MKSIVQQSKGNLTPKSITFLYLWMANEQIERKVYWLKAEWAEWMNKLMKLIYEWTKRMELGRNWRQLVNWWNECNEWNQLMSEQPMKPRRRSQANFFNFFSISLRQREMKEMKSLWAAERLRHINCFISLCSFRNLMLPAPPIHSIHFIKQLHSHFVCCWNVFMNLATVIIFIN